MADKVYRALQFGDNLLGSFVGFPVQERMAGSNMNFQDISRIVGGYKNKSHDMIVSLLLLSHSFPSLSGRR